MRLCCFYNTLDPRTEVSVLKHSHGHEVEWVDTSSDQGAYARELAGRWGQGEDIILVEQDKEIYPATIPECLACGEPFCSYTSWIYPVPHTTLSIGSFGVVKFSAWVQEKIPVSWFAGEQQRGIDRRFYDIALSMGIPAHLHGHVVHHHVYEPRPVAVRERVARLREQGYLAPAVYPEPEAPHLLPGSWDIGLPPDPYRPQG